MALVCILVLAGWTPVALGDLGIPGAPVEDLSADAVAILLKQIHHSAATQEELEKSIWMSFQNNAHDSYRGGKPTQKAIVSVFAQPPNHTLPSDWSRRSHAEIEDPRSVGEQRACAAGGGGLDQNVVTNFLDELP
jgi:hypothetical protein